MWYCFTGLRQSQGFSYFLPFLEVSSRDEADVSSENYAVKKDVFEVDILGKLLHKRESSRAAPPCRTFLFVLDTLKIYSHYGRQQRANRRGA